MEIVKAWYIMRIRAKCMILSVAIEIMVSIVRNPEPPVRVQSKRNGRTFIVAVVVAVDTLNRIELNAYDKRVNKFPAVWCRRPYRGDRVLSAVIRCGTNDKY